MKQQERKGIWLFPHIKKLIPAKDRLTLGEGHTSLVEKDGILFKCEYQNPTGSVKDRGIAVQVSSLKKREEKRCVLSSSGNAAISAAFYCRLANIDLTVFVSQKVNRKKLQKLQTLNTKVIKTKSPLRASFIFGRENNAYNLRQSKDNMALVGYGSIAFELLLQEPEIDAVFLPVSSGTTMVGVARGYKSAKRELPALHIAQTEYIHAVASFFDKDFVKKKTSIVDALVAKYTPREDEIISFVRQSNGFGWVVSDQEAIEGYKWLKEKNLLCSYEGGLTLAAYWKAVKKGYSYKRPVCILTGRYYG